MTKRTNSSVPELLRKVELILRKKDPLPKTVWSMSWTIQVENLYGGKYNNKGLNQIMELR